MNNEQFAPKQPSGWAKLIVAFLLIAVVMIVQLVTGLLIMLVSNTSDASILESLAPISIMEMASGIAAFLCILALGGKTLVKPRLDGLRFSLQASKFVLGSAVLLVVVGSVGAYVGGEAPAIDPAWPTNIITLAFLCLGIGLFEEGVFRGLIFNGLLSRMGTNKKGILAAIIISSLLFGAIHVFPLDSNTVDVIAVAQAVLKTAQTGIFGFILCVIVLKTWNLWLVVAIHSFNDFVLMIVDIGLWGDKFTADYVSTGADAIPTLIIYAVVIAMYLPSFIFCIKKFKEMPAPKRGVFYKMKTVSAAPVTNVTGTAEASNVQDSSSIAYGAMPSNSIAPEEETQHLPELDNQYPVPPGRG